MAATGRGLKVVVAGNIAAGKTTLCCALQSRLPAQLFEEKIAGLVTLPAFYEEMALRPNQHNKYALSLQLEFLELRFQNELRADAQPQTLAVLDRSIYEDRHIFAAALREEGAFTPEQFAAYEAVFEERVARVVPPALFLYLRVPVPTLLRRIELRGREFEQQIQEGYLARLGAQYDAFFARIAENVPHGRVVTIDADKLGVGEVLQAALAALAEHGLAPPS